MLNMLTLASLLLSVVATSLASSSGILKTRQASTHPQVTIEGDICTVTVSNLVQCTPREDDLNPFHSHLEDPKTTLQV